MKSTERKILVSRWVKKNELTCAINSMGHKKSQPMFRPWCTALTHCTDALHRRTDMQNASDTNENQTSLTWQPTSVKLKNGHTTKTNRLQSEWGSDINQSQYSNWKTNWQTDQRAQPLTGAQKTNSEQVAQNSFHPSFERQTTNSRIEFNLRKKKVSFHTSKLRLTNWFHEKNKSARILHNHFCKKEKTISYCHKLKKNKNFRSFTT